MGVVGWIERGIEGNHCLIGGFAKSSETGGRPSQNEVNGFFTEDILAGLHRAEDKINMCVSRRTNIHRLDARKIDGFLKQRGHLASCHFSDKFCPFLVLLEYAEETSPGISYHICRMQLSDSSRSDQCDS